MKLDAKIIRVDDKVLVAGIYLDDKKIEGWSLPQWSLPQSVGQNAGLIIIEIGRASCRERV